MLNAQVSLKGCCCEACIDAPRLLRPVKEQGLYGNWTEYASTGREGKEVAAAMVAGRAEGRPSRRRKRLEALKERMLAKKDVRVERRQRAKEALAAVAGAQGGGECATDGAAERLARMAKLRELREQLQAGNGSM